MQEWYITELLREDQIHISVTMNNTQKSALIIGGSRGIGRRVALGFVQEGFGITVVARDREQLATAEKELRREGAAQGYLADISSFDDVQHAMEFHLERYKCLDVVVNAAAIQGPIGLLWENEPGQWAKNISINLVGTFNVCRAVVPGMIKAGNGAIIFFSGGGAAYARPRFSAYGVGKTGVLRLVETVHEELRECEEAGIKTNSGIQGFRDLGIEGMKETEVGQRSGGKGEEEGVRVYAVAPGAVMTRMTEEVLSDKDSAGEKAFAEALRTDEEGGTPPERAADLCLFLARERPACLSGRLIHVNEPYREYVAKFEGKEMGARGMLRRVGFE